MTVIHYHTVAVNRPVRHANRVTSAHQAKSGPDSSTPSGQARVESVLSAITSQLTQWRSVHQQMTETCQQAVVKLALAIAERIVRQRIEAGEFGIQELVAEIWDRVEPPHATIALHPEDLKLLHARCADWIAEQQARSPVQLVTDVRVSRGTCRMETHHQGFLAGVDVELEGMEELLRGAVG